MNGGKQAIWLFAVLISLACSGWYFASTKPMGSKLNENTLSTTADIVISTLSIRQYDEKGKLAHYLHTPMLRHIPMNNTHWFKTPYIIISQTDQTPWIIQAKQATSFFGGKKIVFQHKVVMQQKKDSNTPESTFKTEEITYYPKSKMAITDKEVTFAQTGNFIQSLGMEAYIDDKRIKLLNNARGHYDTKKA